MRNTYLRRSEQKSGSYMRAALSLFALATFVAGCGVLDRALDVEAPSRIPAAALEDPSKATLLLNGAIADFDCAFGAQVVVSGLVGEELTDASQTANRWPYDRREIAPNDALYASGSCEGIGLYTPLSVARFSADNILKKLEGWTDADVVNRTSMIATAAAYSGYSHVLLGEMFCEGVLLDENLVPGGLATRQQLFERAEQRFTRAIEAARASNNTDILNMALVGRARTRLNLGKKAEAATDARLVPNNYVRNATASSVASRRENRVFAQNNQGQVVSIAPEYRNLTTGGVADPRVRATDTGRTNADGTRVFVQNKYASLTTSLPIATWREAQLIIAEAAVQTNPAEAVSIINALRTRAGVALPTFSSSNPAEIMNQVIEERRRELFLEGHHLGDMIRYNLPFRPATGTVFPAPGNPKGGTYGDTRCLPLPNVERFNNPLIPSA